MIATLFISTLLMATITRVQSQGLSAGYPPTDQPVAPVPEWTARYLTNSSAVIPDIPVNLQQLPKVDWSKDIQQCRSQRKTWALTFDDGPGTYTPIVLDALARANGKATFFVVGSRIAQGSQFQATLRRIARDGHQIGIHTWSHTALTTLTNEQIVAEMMWTARAIRELTGVFPRYMRPPYGDIDDRVRAVLGTMGFIPVIWNHDTNDWVLQTYPDTPDNFTPTNVTRSFQNWISTNPNNIISLQHDLYQYAAGATPAVVQAVQRAGYRLATVAGCLQGQGAYFGRNATIPRPAGPGRSLTRSTDGVAAPTDSGSVVPPASSTAVGGGGVPAPTPTPTPTVVGGVTTGMGWRTPTGSLTGVAVTATTTQRPGSSSSSKPTKMCSIATRIFSASVLMLSSSVIICGSTSWSDGVVGALGYHPPSSTHHHPQLTSLGAPVSLLHGQPPITPTTTTQSPTPTSPIPSAFEQHGYTPAITLPSIPTSPPPRPPPPSTSTSTDRKRSSIIGSLGFLTSFLVPPSSLRPASPPPLPAPSHIPVPVQQQQYNHHHHQQNQQDARMKSDMLQLLTDDSETDVVITVGSDRVELRAHRLILGVRSLYFRRLFAAERERSSGRVKETGDGRETPVSVGSGGSGLGGKGAGQLPRSSDGKTMVDLTFLDPDAFRIILRYLYTAAPLDEATDPSSNDWRLVLACYTSSIFLDIPERCQTYHNTFVSIFSRYSLSKRHADECKEMWTELDQLGLEDLLVSCTPYFWQLFGSSDDNNSNNLCGERTHLIAGMLTVGKRLECLVRIVNAIPAHLEPPIGKFRLVKGWLMAHAGLEEEAQTVCLDMFGPPVRMASLGSEDALDHEMRTTSGSRIGLHRIQDPNFGALESNGFEEDDDNNQNNYSGGSQFIGSPPQSPTFHISANIGKSKKRESFLSNSSSSNGGGRHQRKAAIAGGYPSNQPGDRQSYSSNGSNTTIHNNNNHNNMPNPHSPPTSTPHQHHHHFHPALSLLDLSGITATEIASEIEPSHLLSPHHLLQLYKSAALEKEFTPFFAPLPCGLAGKRYMTFNRKTKSVTIQAPKGHSRSLTYVSMEALSWGSGSMWSSLMAASNGQIQQGGGGGGRGVFRWTVVPLSGVGKVGIGVAGDGMSTGGSTGEGGEFGLSGILGGLSIQTGVGVSGGGGGASTPPLTTTTTGTFSPFSGSRPTSPTSFFPITTTTTTTMVGASPSNPPASRCLSPLGFAHPDLELPISPLSTPRLIGEDGGWSLRSDGTLHIGRIFVGRLPGGVTFTRGTPVTVNLDMDSRTLSYTVGSTECGVAFRNLPGKKEKGKRLGYNKMQT
ncbi:chitin deacetylase [Chytridiales sp. JEL 0842]|nr:chitin deacetylase [Chytridiales sp. JEL 0842]